MTELQKQAMDALEKEIKRMGGTESSYNMKDMILKLDPNYKEVRKIEVIGETISNIVLLISVIFILSFFAYIIYI